MNVYIQDELFFLIFASKTRSCDERSTKCVANPVILGPMSQGLLATINSYFPSDQLFGTSSITISSTFATI